MRRQPWDMTKSFGSFVPRMPHLIVATSTLRWPPLIPRSNGQSPRNSLVVGHATGARPLEISDAIGSGMGRGQQRI